MGRVLKRAHRLRWEGVFEQAIGIKNLVMMYDSAVFFCTPCDDAEGMTADDGPEGLLMSDEKKVFIFDHRGRLQLAAVERRNMLPVY